MKKALETTITDLCQAGMDAAAAFKIASETFPRRDILSHLSTDTGLGGFGAFEREDRAERLVELKGILVDGLGFGEQEAKDWLFTAAAEGTGLLDDYPHGDAERIEFRDVLLSRLGFTAAELIEKFKDFDLGFNFEDLSQAKSANHKPKAQVTQDFSM